MRALALVLAATTLAACGQRAAERPPRALSPLPAPVAGEPVFPRQEGGHLYFGLTDNAPNEETATPAEVAAIATGAGASFVRLDLFWAGVDRTAGQYDWTRYDGQYDAFTRAGVRPLWSVLSTPRHAAKPGVRCSGNFCHGEPADPGALEVFAAAVAARYPLAAALEYRNEPNLDAAKHCSEERSWDVPPREYARNLAAFAAGVRRGRPAMRVIGGALSDCPLAGRPFVYLDALVKAGAAGSMDALSWHPYDDRASPFAEEAARFASVVPEGLRVIVGEAGHEGDPAQQRDRLIAQYRAAERLGYDAFAAFVAVEKKAPDKRAYGWVRRKDGDGVFRAKPVYCAFRALLGGAPLPPFVSCG